MSIVLQRGDHKTLVMSYKQVGSGVLCVRLQQPLRAGKNVLSVRGSPPRLRSHPW